MIVVADTSPLSNLVAIGHLELLHAVYQEVVVPEAVAAEIRVGERRGAHPPFLDREAWITVRSVSDRSLVDELSGSLDPGESEAITLSLEMDAELLLIDERAGRAAAERRGIRTVGLLGTLVVARSRGVDHTRTDREAAAHAPPHRRRTFQVHSPLLRKKLEALEAPSTMGRLLSLDYGAQWSTSPQ